MSPQTMLRNEKGVTLIELLITMAITLFLVAAAAYVYLGTRETQRAIERNSGNTETGTFALQLIGEQIMMAGYYPANTSRTLTLDEGYPKITYYPPTRIDNNAANIPSDWVAPATTPAGIYLTGIFGCDSARFLPASGRCGTASAGTPDSIVINYFTNDSFGANANVGHRFDCTGGNIDRDPSNVNRLNTNPDGPPVQPLFVSNRYAITQTRTEIDKQEVQTFSLACNGNGIAAASDTYQPLLSGIEDMQITYGVFAVTDDKGLRTPERFYTATQIAEDLGSVTVDNGMFNVPTTPWARVSAVRVCIMTRSQGAAPRIADKAGALRTYLDCKGIPQTQDAADTTLRKRFEQVFVVRNRMNQVF